MILDAKPGVIVFFVLSALVLYRSLAPKQIGRRQYCKFVISRAVRLYPVYWLSLILSYVILASIGADSIPPHFQRSAITPGAEEGFHVLQIIAHVSLFSPDIDYTYLNPPIWALAVQFRVAFIFPILVICMRQVKSPALDLLLAAAATFACYLGTHSPFPTIAILPVFIYGAILGKYWDPLVAWLRALPSPTKITIVTLIPAIYIGSYFIHIADESDTIYSYVSAIGACLFLACGVAMRPLSKLLALRPLKALGRSSFGFYLFHQNIIVGFSALAILGGNPWLIGLCSVLVSYALAAIIFRWFEKPILSFSKKRMQPQKARPEGSGIEQHSQITPPLSHGSPDP